MPSKYFDQIQVTPEAADYVAAQFRFEDFLRDALLEIIADKNTRVGDQRKEGQLRDYFANSGWPTIIRELAHKLEAKGVELPTPKASPLKYEVVESKHKRHLYLTNDEPIYQGDWFVQGGNEPLLRRVVTQAWFNEHVAGPEPGIDYYQRFEDQHGYTPFPMETEFETAQEMARQYGFYERRFRKVVASSNPRLDLPGFSDDVLTHYLPNPVTQLTQAEWDERVRVGLDDVFGSTTVVRRGPGPVSREHVQAVGERLQQDLHGLFGHEPTYDPATVQAMKDALDETLLNQATNGPTIPGMQ